MTTGERLKAINILIRSSAFTKSIDLISIRNLIKSAIADDEHFVANTAQYVSRHVYEYNYDLPLHDAAETGHLCLVNLLLEFGFDPDQGDRASCTPLYYAIVKQHYEVAMRLCNVMSNCDKLEIWWPKVLSRESIPKCNDLISKMIQKGYDIYYEGKRHNGVDALTSAIRNGNVEMVRLLMKFIDKGRQGRNFNYLSSAAVDQQYEICQIIIDAGATKEMKGAALMCATEKEDIEMVSLLLKNEASVNFQRINDGQSVSMKAISDGKCMTPLTMAFCHQNWDVLRRGHYEVAKNVVLHERHVDIDLSENESIWDLLRGMPLEKAQRLLKWMEKVHTERKIQGLLDSDLVKEANLPLSIVRLIASPLEWH